MMNELIIKALEARGYRKISTLFEGKAWCVTARRGHPVLFMLKSVKGDLFTFYVFDNVGEVELIVNGKTEECS